MHYGNMVRIGQADFPPDIRNRTIKRDKNANLSPQKKYPESGETELLEHIISFIVLLRFWVNVDIVP